MDKLFEDMDEMDDAENLSGESAHFPDDDDEWVTDFDEDDDDPLSSIRDMYCRGRNL